MSEHQLTEWVKRNLNDCFMIIRENKSNYVRLETLIQIELLLDMIRTFHLEIPIPNRKFYAKIHSLIRTKRHYFKVILDNEYYEKELTWDENE